MSQPAQPAQKASGSIGPVIKLVLIVLALAAIGFSMIVIDIPNRNYLWIVAEAVVAVLFVMSGISYLKQIFGGKR